MKADWINYVPLNVLDGWVSDPLIEPMNQRWLLMESKQMKSVEVDRMQKMMI